MREEREQTGNGLRPGDNRPQVASFSFFSFFYLFSMAEIKTFASNGYKKSEVWYLPQHHRSFLYIYSIISRLCAIRVNTGNIFYAVSKLPVIMCSNDLSLLFFLIMLRLVICLQAILPYC